MSEAQQVDMLAAARDAQWSAVTFLGPGAIKLVAPAKVNLFLGVGERRLDGYHEVTNVMHAVALHDVMYARCEPWTSGDVPADGDLLAAVGGPTGNLLVSIDCADKTGASAQPLAVPASDNLVFKAFDQLARVLGRKQREHVSLRIEKNIPHQGGLGGGSSNAAAALVAAAHFWGLELDAPAVVGTAQKLGADVVFFLKGGCALLTGAGEVYDRALASAKAPLVLVKPPVGVSTPAAYRAFDENPQLATPQQLEQVRNARNAADVPLFNNLAPASETLAPELADVRAWLAEQPGVDSADDVLLCGSGSTTFALTDSFASACTIAAAAQARGWWARATTLSSLRAAKMPR